MGGADAGDDAVAGMRRDDRFMGGVEGGAQSCMILAVSWAVARRGGCGSKWWIRARGNMSRNHVVPGG